MPAPADHRPGPLAVFRFDASPGSGGGHAVRCLALADALAAAGWRCAVACAAGTADVVPGVAAAGRDVLELEPDREPADEAAALAGRWPGGCDLLVVDHYGREAGFEDACRPWSRRIMVIDDLADRPHACDALLDQTHGRRPEDYAGLVPGACRLLLGPRHALLRPPFAAARRAALARRRAGGPLRRVLVSLGATDPANATTTVLDGIDGADGDFEVDVVLGAGAPHLETVGNTGREVSVDVDAADMAGLMADADLAIGAAGTTSWERCCLGLPALLMVLEPNQRLAATELERAGAVRLLGDIENITAEQVAEALDGLARAPERLGEMALAAAGLCNGRGVERVIADLVPAEPADDGADVSLRLATKDDSEIMLEWQSDRRTRRFSRDPRVPGRAEHQGWMRRSLADPDRILTVILHGPDPAGVLRFDPARRGDGFEVSILVAPDSYRLGIGRAALALARKLFPGDDLYARVLADNAASLALFDTAGYREIGGGYYRNTPSVGEVPDVR